MKSSLALLRLLLVAPGGAQQPSSGSPSDHELVQQVIQRVNELEAQVQRLQQTQPAAHPSETRKLSTLTEAMVEPDMQLQGYERTSQPS